MISRLSGKDTFRVRKDQSCCQNKVRSKNDVEYEVQMKEETFCFSLLKPTLTQHELFNAFSTVRVW